MSLSVRRQRIQTFESEPPRQLCIVGGGATGAGAALEAYVRGISFYWICAGDVGQGSSSRSTKLFHGGLRYLAKGDFSLVKEALKERQWLLNTYPEYVRKQTFILPVNGWAKTQVYAAALKLYDRWAKLPKRDRSKILCSKEVADLMPGFTGKSNRGIAYLDAQFNDQAFLSAIWMEMDKEKAHVLNYAKLISIKKKNGSWCLTLKDEIEDYDIQLNANYLFHAAGPSSLENLKAWGQASQDTMVWSQGSHLLLKKTYCSWKHAFIMPTKNGRVFFMIPWEGQWLAGTTEKMLDKLPETPSPYLEELEEICASLEKWVGTRPKGQDIVVQFAGIRPLILTQKGSKRAGFVSRKHLVREQEKTWVNVYGGKWTIFRKMGEDGLRKLFGNHLPPIIKPYPVLRPLEKPPLHFKDLDLDFYRNVGLAMYPDDVWMRRLNHNYSHLQQFLNQKEAIWEAWEPNWPKELQDERTKNFQQWLPRAISDPKQRLD